jgi:hypothetical protein
VTKGREIERSKYGRRKGELRGQEEMWKIIYNKKRTPGGAEALRSQGAK